MQSPIENAFGAIRNVAAADEVSFLISFFSFNYFYKEFFFVRT